MSLQEEIAIIQPIIDKIVAANGTPYIVGGSVRDELMGYNPKDIDVEVFGIPYATLQEILQKFGRCDLVGESFGVLKFKFHNREYDFSIPRRDNKTGEGHKGFDVKTDPFMSTKEAASRRDFTINSIMFDLKEKRIEDPFNGQEDIKNKILRHTSTKTFVEDPLRVLRGMQFSSRFDLHTAPETVALCLCIMGECDTLPKERLWGEWYKWATKSVVPSNGLQFLKNTGWSNCFPEIHALIDVPQDLEWHPEGNVFVHTSLVCDAMDKICRRENIDGEDKALLMFAALTHDFGKPSTTAVIDGRVRSPKHEPLGVPIAEKFLESIGCLPRLITPILPLVKNHLVHVRKAESDRAVRKLSLRLGKATIEQLGHLVEADMSGRPPLPAGQHPAMIELLERAKNLSVVHAPPDPIIKGRHVLELGLQPGKLCGLLVKKCYQQQLNGTFTTEEEGKKVLREIAAKHGIINGQHLIDIGLSPGPIFGKILQRCLNAQLAGEFKTEEQAVVWLSSNIGVLQE